jgi:D-glycero-D-manno-heptose 1,7-bisphosphate phosphatase
MTYTTVFLDRDGVINYDSPDYVKSWEDFHFIPGSRSAIARLTKAGVTVILITNQSMINRGMVPLRDLIEMHKNLVQAVSAAGGRITDILYCPHRPDERCTCRKPRPGMILTARDRHQIDLSQAAMIGDSAKDILAGKNAGCGLTVLVRTGNGQSAMKELKSAGQQPDHVADDLYRAVDWILGKRR